MYIKNIYSLFTIFNRVDKYLKSISSSWWEFKMFTQMILGFIIFKESSGIFDDSF